MLKGIIFDFDGTLVDTETLIYEAVRDFLLSEYECCYSKDTYQLSVGQSDELFFENMERTVGRRVDQEALSQKIRADQQAGYRKLPLRLGIETLIQQAKQQQLHLAVVSNSSREELDFFFKYHPALSSQFSEIVTIEDVKAGKPEPDSYLKCLTALGLTTKEVFAVEDSAVGAKAAIAAGIQTIIYPNEFTANMLFPEKGEVLTDITDLLKVLV